jgi:L-seryl-tRNA(Ser) seleniumtransferase
MDLRDLPSVDGLATVVTTALLPRTLPAALIVAVARDALDAARSDLLSGADDVDPLALAMHDAQRLASLRPGRVVNATGVLLHTNLGRAPWAADAASLASQVAGGYANVEFELATGGRGSRSRYLAELLRSVTGAEAGLAVNNNAGALLLALAALAGPGCAVAVSRGELIEIGGSFRLPDLMASSGARLVEVGTTNRTRGTDYAKVIEQVDLLLKVHPSNYRIEGFSEEVGYRSLADLAAEHGVPMVADVGSGLLDTRTPWLDGPPPGWLTGEPGVRQTLEEGADVVLFSGDKLLGGPQAGIAVGRADLIETMARHPMARALRIDGVAQAGLSVTLEAYATGDAGNLPFWKMASLGDDALRKRLDAILAESGVDGDIVMSESIPGAGSVPGETIPSPALRLPGHGDGAWQSLIAGDPPVVGRRRNDALFVDVRTVDPADDPLVVAALRRLAARD